MTYTPSQIWDAVITRDERDSFFDTYNSIDQLWSQEDGTTVLIRNFGLVEIVDTAGGVPDGGSYCHVVIRVATGQLFRFTGYYNSYEDNEWYDTDVNEVEPVTVTTTIYREV